MTSESRQSQSQSYVTTDGQSASLSLCQAPIWGLRPDFYFCQTVASLLMWGALSDERVGLSFTIAAGPSLPAQSFSGPSPAGLMTNFYCLRFKTPPTCGPAHRIYIPQEQGGPVMPPGIAFPFRRLLRLAGLLWNFSTPPPHGRLTDTQLSDGPRREHTFPVSPLENVRNLLPNNGRCLQSRYLATGLRATIYFSLIMENGTKTFLIFVLNKSSTFKRENYVGILDFSEHLYVWLCVEHAIGIHNCKKFWRTHHRHIFTLS
jgi:hypothetical protein